MSERWPRLLGILGGLGPHAHLHFEQRLLAAVGDAARDQDYPGWLLASVPETPDRTAALVASAASPVASMVRGLERLRAGGADFAVIACNTAHAFLPELRRRVDLPLLDLVELTLEHIVERWGARARVGLLATTGTLRSGLYPSTGARVAPELTWRTLLDLADGEALQDTWVMRAIFGPADAEGRRAGGIKAGGSRDPLTGEEHRVMLARAVERLAQEGIDVAICGCTEIPLALGSGTVGSTPLVDPLEVAAAVAVEIAAGRREVPWRG